MTDLGATALKNIAEPVHAYSVEVGKAAKARPKAFPSKPRWGFAALAAAIGALLLLAAASGWFLLGSA